jgi:membrane protease YdiL (CAAX protease family)
MSPIPVRATTRPIERPAERAAAAAAACSGLALLALRPLVAAGGDRTLLMAVTFGCLLAVSLALSPGGRERPAVAPPMVLAIGVGAVLASTFVAGSPPPFPFGPAAVALGSLAAVAEEAFFRRFLYGRLARLGAVAAVGGSALLFAMVHVPVYGVAAFWVDLGAGLLFSWQRWASGGWSVSASTHVVANLLAVMR